MIVRSLDVNHDWTFGQGLNDYLINNQAIAQNIQTRLLQFLGDCFFDTSAGIDWFTFLGSKNEVALNLAISGIILNTIGVTGIRQLNLTLTSNRSFNVSYSAQTIYSVTGNAFQYNLGGGLA